MQHINPNDLNARILAYRGAEEDGPPALWNPEWVMSRLIEAFEVIGKTVGRVGPSSQSNAWPSMLMEFHELIDAQTRAQMTIDRRIIWERQSDRPSSLQIQRADEASVWCARYLPDDPLRADALQLWAFAKAHDIDMRKLLRRRAVRADAMVEVRQADEDALRARRRRDIVSEACTWANHRLEHATDAAHAARIRANAQIRAARALEANAEAVAPIRVKRQDVLPGKVMSRTRLDLWRKEAAAILADRLHNGGVIVR